MWLHESVPADYEHPFDRKVHYVGDRSIRVILLRRVHSHIVSVLPLGVVNGIRRMPGFFFWQIFIPDREDECLTEGLLER